MDPHQSRQFTTCTVSHWPQPTIFIRAPKDLREWPCIILTSRDALESDVIRCSALSDKITNWSKTTLTGNTKFADNNLNRNGNSYMDISCMINHLQFLVQIRREKKNWYKNFEYSMRGPLNWLLVNQEIYHSSYGVIYSLALPRTQK